jgi:hypothetical protein
LPALHRADEHRDAVRCVALRCGVGGYANPPLHHAVRCAALRLFGEDAASSQTSVRILNTQARDVARDAYVTGDQYTVSIA